MNNEFKKWFAARARNPDRITLEEAFAAGARSQPTPSVPNAMLVAVADLFAQMAIVSRVGFIDTPGDKDSCAAFCVAEGTWLELVSCVESLAAAINSAPKMEAKS